MLFCLFLSFLSLEERIYRLMKLIESLYSWIWNGIISVSSGFKKETSKKLHISSVQRKSVRPKPLLASGKCLVNASCYSLFGVYLLKYLTEKEELRFKHNWLLEKHYLCLNSLNKSSLTHSALTIPDRNSNRNGKNGFSITCLSHLGGSVGFIHEGFNMKKRN